MGFWSKNCMRPGCGHPALSRAATTEVNAWMSRVVAINRDGSTHIGEYDGYGRVADAEDALAGDVTLYHEACWRVLGQPLEFTGDASWSDDQGWFFNPGAHDLEEPRTDASLRSATDQAITHAAGMPNATIEFVADPPTRLRIRADYGHLLTNVLVTRANLVAYLLRYRDRLVAAQGYVPRDEPAWLRRVPIEDPGAERD